jgi:hypothetical protein
MEKPNWQTLLICKDLLNSTKSGKQLEIEFIEKYGSNLTKFEMLINDLKNRHVIDFSIKDGKISAGYRPVNIEDGSLLFMVHQRENFLEEREKFLEEQEKYNTSKRNIADR